MKIIKFKIPLKFNIVHLKAINNHRTIHLKITNSRQSKISLLTKCPQTIHIRNLDITISLITPNGILLREGLVNSGKKTKTNRI